MHDKRMEMFDLTSREREKKRKHNVIISLWERSLHELQTSEGKMLSIQVTGEMFTISLIKKKETLGN